MRRFVQPIELDPDDVASIADLLPDHDPRLDGGVDGVIPVCDTRLDGDELANVTECVNSGWISSAGPFVGRFEKAFAQSAGTEHAIACANGTVALHLVLATLDIGPGDEVIVPAFTMTATAAAVAYTGATPVFVDVLPGSGNIDPTCVRRAITPSTRAVIAVHVYGRPVDIDALEAAIDGHDIVIVEDAAEAHGATWAGRPVGSLGIAASFSFYANKIITTGEGGMITTNDSELASLARTLRDHAFSSDRHFWHRYLGFNYRMTALQAAVGLAQVERLNTLVDRKRALARRYSDGLRDLDLVLPDEGPKEKNVFWMFGVQVRPDAAVSRDELRRRLAATGIETRTFFVPLHLQPIWRSTAGRCARPVAEELGATGLYLPSGPSLTDRQIERVIAGVRSALA